MVMSCWASTTSSSSYRPLLERTHRKSEQLSVFDLLICSDLHDCVLRSFIDSRPSPAIGFVKDETELSNDEHLIDIVCVILYGKSITIK